MCLLMWQALLAWQHSICDGTRGYTSGGLEGTYPRSVFSRSGHLVHWQPILICMPKLVP
jgi:hypothetical protein